ncbi:YfhO family protein [bacterium]|nr:YfhO family protein [bacterium]
MKRRFFVFWPHALLLGLVFVFFWDSFLAGKALVMRDTVIDFFPWRLFGRQAFRAGTLPLWNHYSSCGSPFIANPQSAFFYPPNLLFYVLPPVAALKLWHAFHFAVAAISMHALARHWKLGLMPALIAAVAFAFGANTICAVEFQSMIGTLAWNPLALLLTSRLVEEGRNRRAGLKSLIARLVPPALLLALVLATQFLAGHGQSFLLSITIDLMYLLLIGLRRLDLRAFFASGAAWASAAALALGLSMTQFLLTWQLVPLSVRGDQIDPQMKMASLDPRLFLGWLMPFIAGHPGHLDQWWGRRLTMFEFWVGTAYVGIAPLMLASIGLLRLGVVRDSGAARRLRRLALFLVLLAAAGLVMAMGVHTPIYAWCYSYLPFIDKFRWPAKFLQIVAFALPLLAALGLHHLCRGTTPSERRLQLSVMFAWALLWVAMAAAWIGWRHSASFYGALTKGAFLPYATPRNLDALADDLGRAVLFLGLALAAVCPLAFPVRPGLRRLAAASIVIISFANLFVIGRQIQPILADDVYRHRALGLINTIDDADPGRIHLANLDNQLSLYGVRDPLFYTIAKDSGVGESSLPNRLFKINGGDALTLFYLDSVRRSLWTLPRTDPNWLRVAALFNTRYIVKTAPMRAMLAGAAPTSVEIEETSASLPRAMVVSSWSVETDSAKAMKRLLAPDFDLYRSIIVDAVPEGWPAEQPVSPIASRAPIARLADAGVEKIEYGWNRVDVTARSGGRAFLFLDDIYFPGWIAAVDGVETPILLANRIFRAVPLPAAGMHRIEFRYRPALVPLGMSITAATVLAMVLLALFARRVRNDSAA